MTTKEINDKKVKNVFLDLDNTLISSEPTESFNPKDYKEIQDMTFHNMEDYYVVFERPHLQEFLDYLFDNFNVSVWTAATKDYALFIVDKVLLTKPGRDLEYIFFNYHCNWSRKNKCGVKGLKMLWEHLNLPGFNEDNTIIIDDLSDVKNIQPNNAIQVKAFEIDSKGSENDKELLDVKKKLEDIKSS